MALSWFLASCRADFTFRSRIFGGFPQAIRHAAQIIADVNRFYLMECKIYDNCAEYSIDGVKYASCKYGPGIVPSEGYFGMGNYGSISFSFKDLKITSLPPLA
jgi:hypothetical protein